MSTPGEPKDPSIVPPPADTAVPPQPPAAEPDEDTGDEPTAKPDAAVAPASAPAEPVDAAKAQAEKERRKKEQAWKQAAEVLYAKLRPQLIDILYSQETDLPPDADAEDSTPIKLTAEQLSYSLYTHNIARNVFGFKYDGAEAKPGRRTKPTDKLVEQTFSAHHKAEGFARKILIERFEADRKRIDEVVKLLEAKATEKAKGEEEQFYKTRVKNPGDRKDNGGAIGPRVRGYYKSLERLRLYSLDDVVDWYRMRVSQVESMIQQVTLKKDRKDIVPDRIKRLDTDSAIRDALAQLEADFKVIEDAVAVEPRCPQESDNKYFKAQALRRLQGATRIRDYLNKSRERLNNLLTENRDGRNRIEQAVDRVIEGLEPMRLRAVFLDEARNQTVGLSPEGELNFWEAMNEYFDEYGGEVTGKYDSAERRASISQRYRTMTASMRLTEPYLDGPISRERLARAAEGAPIISTEDHTPQNVDEFFARVKLDALTLGELRPKMRRTFAIMGPAFHDAVKVHLRKGIANANKIDYVEYMNGLLAKAQKEAIQALADDETFKTGLAGRDVKELRWSNKADQPLITALRTKICEKLNLGTPDKLDVTAIPKLFVEPPSAEETKEEAEAAAEMANAEPVIRQLLEGKLDPAIIANAYPAYPKAGDPAMTPDILVKETKELMKSIRDAANSSPFRDALITHFNSALKEPITTGDHLRQVLHKLLIIDHALGKLKTYFGKDWATAAGLIKKDAEGKMVVDEEILVEGLVGLGETDNFIGGLKLSSEPMAQAGLLAKVDSGVTSRLDHMQIPKHAQLYTALLGLQVELQKPEVHPSTALKRLVKLLETGKGTGIARLVELHLAKPDPDDQPDGLIMDVTALRTVIFNDKAD